MNPYASIRRVALGAALATTVLGASLGVAASPAAAALPQTCLKDGVCFTKAFNGAKTTLTVTGTAGNDSIVVAHVPPFSNNTPSGNVSVNGKNTHVNEGAGLTIVVNALAGNDHVTEQFPGTAPLYGTSTIDGGAGDDVLTASFRSDVVIGGPGRDVLDGGAGNDQLLAQDATPDTLHGGPGIDTAQRDAVDTLDGVESVQAQPLGRLRLAPDVMRARAGRWSPLTVSWTHPKSWRELREIYVGFYRDAKQLGMINIRPQQEQLATSGAVQIMANARVAHGGRQVTARLHFRLARRLTGQQLRIAVTATERHGRTQSEPDAGLVRLTH
jgi:hypothetical protein